MRVMSSLAFSSGIAIRPLALVFALAASLIVDSAFAKCRNNADCDDGVYCNGMELCDWNNRYADSEGCHPGAAPCEPQVSRCDEQADYCDFSCRFADADGDGVDAVECGGADCDDNNMNVYPGNTEICDPHNLNEDCDPTTIGDRDLDHDGFIDEACVYGN
jgi:hypothetical protein